MSSITYCKTIQDFKKKSTRLREAVKITKYKKNKWFVAVEGYVDPCQEEPMETSVGIGVELVGCLEVVTFLDYWLSGKSLIQRNARMRHTWKMSLRAKRSSYMKTTKKVVTIISNPHTVQERNCKLFSYFSDWIILKRISWLIRRSLKST